VKQSPNLHAMEQFSNVTVVPSISRNGPIYCGGPIWPDWDKQVLARHCRNRRPVDSCPELPKSPLQHYNSQAVWGGNVYWQFGHQIAEFSTRILQSLAERNGDKFLFGVLPNQVGKQTLETTPSSFLAIADWYGLKKENIELVHEPLLVENLYVAMQGEQMGRVPPTAQYLDLLDENWDRKKIRPEKREFVYVSRAKLNPFFGNHAGAGYLDQILMKSGVKVIHPEQLPLSEQLSIYRGAEALIFSEGSALHGLQMLGRGLGSVSVFNRRTKDGRRPRRMAAPQLLPRANDLTYLDAVKHQLHFYSQDGIGLANSALSIFDAERLINFFEGIGIRLRTHWVESEYVKSKENDVRLWVENGWARHGGRLKVSHQNLLIRDLNDSDLGHLVDFAQAAMVRKK